MSECIRIAGCDADQPIVSSGEFYETGTIKADEGNCSIRTATWFGTEWGCCDVSLGAKAWVDGRRWWVKETQKADCIMMIELQAPVLDCPDCYGVLYKLKHRSARSCRQDQAHVDIVGTDLAADVCKTSTTTDIVNGVEKCIEEISICVDSPVDIEPGMYFKCGGDVYRITEVSGPCGPDLLPTYKAVADRTQLLEEALDSFRG